MPRGRTRQHHLPTSEIVALYVEQQVGVENIAKRYGCSGPTVAARLREAGVTIRRCNDTKRGAPSPLRQTIDNAAAVRMYTERENTSAREVAKAFSCHVGAIYRALDAANVPRKSLSAVIKDKRNGSANSNWRDDLTDDERVSRRDMAKQAKWRAAVYKLNEFTCQKCGDAEGGNLNAHHIESHSTNVARRWEVSNGITFCVECHRAFHSRFGLRNNNAAQLAEYLGTQKASPSPIVDNLQQC